MRARALPQSSSRAVAYILAFLLLAGLLAVGSARAHTFTKSDGNDSPGKLDIRTSTVSHTSTSIVFKIRTYNSWTPASLQNDSYLAVTIDKNNDRTYERCAVIIYASRLRALLTNCGRNVIRNLPVAKLNPSTVKVTIPKAQTGLVHWWATETWWDGAAPCRNGCIDFSPNRFPDILHDLLPPTINLNDSPLRTWESATTLAFHFPFTVGDANSGVRSWKVQRRTFEVTSWTTVASGSLGGSKNPLITAVPGHSIYRVVVTDKHGNVKMDTRRVFAPRDDRDLAPAGTFNDPTPIQVPDGGAFEGTLTFLGVGESLEYVYTHTSGPCRPIELIGLGGGDWTVDVSVNGLPEATLDGTTFAGDRQVLFSHNACDSTTFNFLVTEANFEFPIDGVVAKAG